MKFIKRFIQVNREIMASFERWWVSLTNSDTYRKHAKYGIGGRLFRSPAYQSINRSRRYLTTLIKTIREPDVFDDVRTYCTFIGHNKSGTTLLGSLIDAHPNAILGDEVDAVQYFSTRFRRDQIFHQIIASSRRDYLKGRVTARRLGGYSFLVPGQWQGRYERLRVIGDSTSGATTRRLAHNLELIGTIQAAMPGVQTKYIQVVRNPFDPISAYMIRGKRTFDNAINHYFSACDRLEKIRSVLEPDNLLVIRYENLIASPRKHLHQVFQFLGLELTEEFLSACTSILYQSPFIRRGSIPWTQDWVEAVENQIQKYEFLTGYHYRLDHSGPSGGNSYSSELFNGMQ
jgi:hypothetical protein